MKAAEPLRFTRLADGTTLLRQPDGSYQPVQTQTDWERLGKMTEAEIEVMSQNDPDHPGLDDAFWADFDARQAKKEAISIKLDEDILSFFRKQGRGYQTRINNVLRRYVQTHK